MTDATAGGTKGGRKDPVTLFERHRAEMLRARRGTTILLGVLFVGFTLWSAWISNFTPQRLAEGLPRIFEYFQTITPALEWDKLFVGRDASGDAVPGSITFWYTDFWKYMELLGVTILMALTATMLGAGAAFLMCFPAARNLTPNYPVYWITRRFMEFCRGVPEILFALVFVFMVGIGPLAGVLAIAVHTAGALGKLFAEVNENASLKPVDGIAAVGGTWAERMLLGVFPQVAPNLISYGLLRFEINVRSSAIVGFVGAGGIGQELNRTISFYSDDRVLAVLILVVVTVTLIDLLSERVRERFIGTEST
jgi:phosphonate transport system permease protein